MDLLSKRKKIIFSYTELYTEQSSVKNFRLGGYSLQNKIVIQADGALYCLFSFLNDRYNYFLLL